MHWHRHRHRRRRRHRGHVHRHWHGHRLMTMSEIRHRGRRIIEPWELKVWEFPRSKPLLGNRIRNVIMGSMNSFHHYSSTLLGHLGSLRRHLCISTHFKLTFARERRKERKKELNGQQEKNPRSYHPIDSKHNQWPGCYSSFP